MNAKALTIILSIATMVLTACGNDDAIDNWNGEIRLTSGMVAQQTRASFGQDKQLVNGQLVSVFVDKTTSAEKLYDNTVLTAGDNGSLTSSTAMYYPVGGSNVDVYAFHPSLTSVTAYPAAVFTHTVSNAQSTNTNYLASDLLYAASKNNEKSANAINLTFYHMLSKVEVALKSGTGAPDLTGATVTIVGTKLKASFTPSKTTAIATENDRAGMITASATDNTAAAITIGTKITTDDFATTDYAEAVIVPQEVASGTAFIQVKLADGTTTYTYKLDAATTFVSGKKYQYKITVNKSELTVSSSITDWGTGTGSANTGSAEIQ